MYKQLLAISLGLCLAGCSSLPPTAAPEPAEIPNLNKTAAPIVLPPEEQVTYNIQTFVKQSAKDGDFTEAQIQAIIKQAKFQPIIIQLMNRPNEKLPWYRYQELYVRPSLVTSGATFWSKYQSTLNSATKQFGVPSEIIVSILGVETGYGKNQGQYRALDALYTLSFYYPRRAAYFQNELDAFLVLSYDANFDPLTLKSSYAGALGMPQFMPSTYRHYAVSSSKNYPDLFHNPQDAIGSVANYLDKVGWRAGGPIAVPARLGKGVVPTDAMQNGNLTLEALKKLGVHATRPMNGALKANLISLQTKTGTEYWLVFHNFYSIKRYNSSTLYAMAVYQLSDKILQQKQQNDRVAKKVENHSKPKKINSNS